jgi:threonyl-tRNA synthetase
MDMNDKKQLETMRHSLAHIMATAIKHLWPEVKFGVGPAVDDGFYYDIDLGEITLSEDKFKDISREMDKIISDNQPFEKSTMPIDEAIEWAKREDQPYKLELLNDLKRAGTTEAKDIDASELGVEAGNDSKVEEVSFYTNGDFTDLCRGPHVESTGNVGKYKLMRVSGAYWRGDEHKQQIQRIYGMAFNTQSELDEHLAYLEEAKKSDHRKIGQELDLYVISPLVGAGLPLFTPRGTILRDELNRYSQELRKAVGYENVWVPHIAKQELYEVSGHWDKFGDQWLTVDSKESHDKLVMKPMNCPHHQQIYAAKPRSYRDLPIKYMETTTVYRDEKAGELMGLSRVRSITQDDSHTFCSPEQIDEVLTTLVNITQEFYKTVGMDLKVRLSFRGGSPSYLGKPELWDRAQAIIKEVVEKAGLEYFIAEGDAAFYGPKIDFVAKDSLGRNLQLATPQLDFVQPERFGLKYADEDGSEKTPVMIHFALLGSIERFLAAYIENSVGRFPVWLAPEQVRLITVNQEDKTIQFADKIAKQAKQADIRLTIDNSNESVGKKIRNSELMKVPYTVVIGEKEIETGDLVPRIRKDLVSEEKNQTYKFDQFIETVVNETKSRASKSSI